jgi:hypothetical protein
MSGSRSSQNAIINHQNEQIAKQYEMDLKNYEFQYGLRIDDDGNFHQQYDDDGTKAGAIQDQYEFAQEGLELRKQADRETRDYQQETADQNWEQGKSMQQFQWDQEDRIYNKNIDQYTKTIDYNEIAYADALARERAVLDERFIGAAFENQGLIQDLYEQTGSAGFNKTAQKLNLLAKEDNAEYNKQKQLINLKQNTETARYRTGEEELNILDRRGKSGYQTATQYLDLASKESQNRYAKARLLLDTKMQQQMTDYENEMIRREHRQQMAEGAQQATDQEIAALKASGEAQLTQAGRSQGKTVQVIMSELGRHQTYLAESLVRGQNIAEARMKQNRINTLNTVQKAALAEQQLNFDTVQNITRTMTNVEEINRGMKLSDAKSQLNMDEIRKGVMDNFENAEVDVKKIERDLLHTQTATGLDLKKIDWSIDNLGSRFKTNQDILTASLESAVRTSQMNQKDILRDKTAADIRAEAMKMLDPSVGRENVDLDKFRPLDIPLPVYQDPLAPNIPPAPIQGAMQSQMGLGAAIPGAALSGVTMGLGAYSMASAGLLGGTAATGSAAATGAIAAAGPIGLLAGLGGFALGLF